jgi:alkaline phosphatase
MKGSKTIGIFIAVIVLLSIFSVIAFASGKQGNGTDDSAAWNDNKKAKNVIVFVGDGMGSSTITATRWYLEQNGLGDLYMDSMPYAAPVRTESINCIVTDSAPAASALFSGHETNNGMINWYNGESFKTILDDAEKAGKATGAITTTRITHATPAGTFAKTSNRDDENDIALQMLRSGIDVAMGGGIRQFINSTEMDPESGKAGKRTDGRNLINEFKARGYVYVNNSATFNAIDLSKTTKLLGLFEYDHMQYEADRSGDKSGEPSLSEMTSKAIQVLSNDRDGFFLMVEGGRIDHAHHETKAYKAITDTAEFDEAIRTAASMVDLKNTLIIVVADHSHTFVINGYPYQTDNILGMNVTRNAAGTITQAYPILSYTTGVVGFNMSNPAHLWKYETANLTKETQYPSAIQLAEGDTHAGEMVVGYAVGPGAENLHGTLHLMDLYNITHKAMFGRA